MEKLLSVREVADKLRCHPQTIYRNTKIPRTNIPGIGIRFKESSLESFLNASSIGIPPNQYDIFPRNLPKPLLSPILTAGGGSEMAKAKSKSRINLGYGAIYSRKTKKGKIRWYLDFKGASGKRVQKVVTHALCPEEAVVALKNEITKVFRSEYDIQSPKTKAGFGEFAKIYLDNYAKVKKRSWESDQKYIRAQLVPFFGSMALHEINPLHVSQFISKRLKDGVRKSSINRELTVMKKMLNLAIEWDFDLAKNPVVKGNYFAEDEFKRDRTLSQEEEKRLIKASSPHLRPILVCALSTGMRHGEVLGLSWDDVDLEKKQIIVRAECSKSGRSRTIPMNSVLYDVLRKLKLKSNGTGGKVFLYEDPSMGKERPVKTVRRAFTQACRRAGINNFRFHDLRHTFATRLIDRGADPVSVKNLLGHANLKTTEIYLHSSLSQMKKAVDLLDPQPLGEGQNPPNPLRICDTKRDERKAGIASSSELIN
jgi:integrase